MKIHSIFTDIRLWDIIAEIISLTHPPPPANPFEVDMYYFDTLPLEECVTSTGAMVDFLQRVWVHAKETCTYADRGSYFAREKDVMNAGLDGIMNN